uniref:Uncharacterized protein n=1 Tax=Meloidogyne hapla TaxID=6305 RepID=A0A1I8C0I5_MELHA
MQPPFAWHSPSTGIQSEVCYSSNPTTSTKLISQQQQTSPTSTINPPQIYNNSTNSSQYYNNSIQDSSHYYNTNQQNNQEERIIPRETNQIINNQPNNCSWGVLNTQMQHHFVPTPSTPVPAIYSGTSPSPPQRFGVGGVGGGGGR